MKRHVDKLEIEDALMKLGFMYDEVIEGIERINAFLSNEDRVISGLLADSFSGTHADLVKIPEKKNLQDVHKQLLGEFFKNVNSLINPASTIHIGIGLDVKDLEMKAGCGEAISYKALSSHIISNLISDNQFIERKVIESYKILKKNGWKPVGETSLQRAQSISMSGLEFGDDNKLSSVSSLTMVASLQAMLTISLYRHNTMLYTNLSRIIDMVYKEDKLIQLKDVPKIFFIENDELTFLL